MANRTQDTATAIQPVGLYSPAGLPVAPLSASGPQTAANSASVTQAQGTFSGGTKVTLAANTAAQLVPASSGAPVTARILNWTASPIYLDFTVTGTPASGAPSEFIPAAASGVPGQWESRYYFATGLRGVGASAGDLTVEYA